ncbi:Uncharacterized protein TCM_035013 [Theobroma cacao]|uniref:Uncharacterized protein n=1 Tax=Theobroma cacao TaxID=3641 RepID=A0A061FGL5_THECC|nr:Uncharacterized protein TCM_035013 [Theobroma cacao]
MAFLESLLMIRFAEFARKEAAKMVAASLITKTSVCQTTSGGSIRVKFESTFRWSFPSDSLLGIGRHQKVELTVKMGFLWNQLIFVTTNRANGKPNGFLVLYYNTSTSQTRKVIYCQELAIRPEANELSDD